MAEKSSNGVNGNYWKYIHDNFEEINKEREEFSKEYSILIGNNTDEMAVVLKCHLIIEYYINDYLAFAFPAIHNLNKLNLRFVNKIEMINNPNTIFGFYHESLKEFNTLRNKFAHNLRYSIVESDIVKIKSVMDAWNIAAGNDLTSGIDLIKQYTLWLSSSIKSTTLGIKKEAKELGISGYIKWLEEMQK